MASEVLRSEAVRSWKTFQHSKAYDVLAAMPMILWYGLAAAQQSPDFLAKLSALDAGMLNNGTLDIAFIVSLLAQGAGIVLIIAVLAFLLLRSPARAKAPGLLPRLAAFFGTYLGVGVVWLPAAELNTRAALASLIFILAGVGFSIYALLHLGRSFSVMAEARRLVTDGPYAHIRHPLYLGEALAMLGLTMQHASPLAFLIFLVQCAFQLLRMSNEERVLAAQFSDYAPYRRRTARLLPGLY